MTKEEAIRILSTRDSYGMVTGYAGGIKEAIDMGLEALKQEPCPYWDYGSNTCRHANIGALATVTPIRPKGEWETGYTYPDGEYWKCSECGELIKVKFPMNFCNSCGADMRGNKDAT